MFSFWLLKILLRNYGKREDIKSQLNKLLRLLKSRLKYNKLKRNKNKNQLKILLSLLVDK